MTQSLSVENVSKRYRLGYIGSGTASEDIKRWWTTKVMRRDDPFAPVMPTIDHGNRDGDILWALRDVSFTVDQGEVLGIIGKNGAGKSTLLKILAQITAPTSGRIRVNGRLASLLEVGTGFNGELNGRDNIYLNGGILGMTPDEIKRRFDEIVDFAEIEEFIDTPVKRYSSGMSVRLAFSVAAHLETDIMVIDEVLAVGDIGFQKKCLGKMSDSSSAGRTILFVSHRMDHITALCPRSIVMQAGRVVHDGPTEGALSHYYSLFDKADEGPLADRLDRRGRGRVRVIDVWVENEQGRRVETVITGQALVFRMHIRNMTNKPVRNLKANIAIFTFTNMFAASLSTVEGGLGAFTVEDERIVSFRVEKLPLNQGQFYFNCSVRSATGAYEYDDLIENAKTLHIDYGDFHGIGQSGGGFVSIEHHASSEAPEVHPPKTQTLNVAD